MNDMIHDSLQNLSSFVDKKVCQRIMKIVTDPAYLSEDKRIEIAGEDVYANISHTITRKRSDAKIESHINYCDIQIIISGRECIDTYDVTSLEKSTEYDPVKDIQFFKESEEIETKIVNTPGHFALLFPRDAHRPMYHDSEANDITKVVIKIKQKYLKIQAGP